MLRTQIDPRQQGMRPHNRLGQYDQMYNSDGTLFNPEMAPQQQGGQQRPPQQQASQPASGGFDIGQFLTGMAGSSQAPSWGGLDISGYSAGGGMQVGPDGITITNPNQQAALTELIRRSAGNEQAQMALQGSMFGDLTSAGAQLGTAGINAGAQRDVAGINAQSNEAIAMTQAQSATDVANIQAQSAAQIEQLRQAGLISQQEADQKLAETNNAAQQRIAEIQAEASIRPAELQFEQFGMGLEAIQPFMQALLGQMGGGGSFGGSAYQVDPQSLVNAAQAQNAMGAAAANRTGGGGGGAAANSAAARDVAQQEAAANAQAAYQIPLQVGQQNFDNRQAAQANDLQRLQSLAQFIPNLFSAIG